MDRVQLEYVPDDEHVGLLGRSRLSTGFELSPEIKPSLQNLLEKLNIRAANVTWRFRESRQNRRHGITFKKTQFEHDLRGDYNG